ncbi:hypothetical protein NP233_g1609 [Leucocoprinus birnbaumii]|uniref:Peptidase C14 caspase domain-containing protein n=1 Tax=Leucocoprinus birnbaumii TaxID=56174 RepID=A0AAD5W083_9AGAR|nr:hypothetical protein NP233_g1609 [Leucocoprinus birnbaumii]
MLRQSIRADLIGIDDYNEAELQCAVADTEAMYEFLVHRLSVPKEHINLLSAKFRGNRSSPDYPTRQNILRSLWSLHRDDRISHGDTIIIFFAGRGSLYCPSVLPGDTRNKEFDCGWVALYELNRGHPGLESDDDHPSNLFIDAFVPPDHGEPEPPDSIYHGKLVPDLSDRELNAIFSNTRLKKGPNILFISDCSHFAPSCRGSDHSGLQPRTRSTGALGRRQMEDMLSRAKLNIDHGVCRDTDQKVQEHFKRPNGVFTGALLDTLLQDDDVNQNITFDQLVDKVAKRMKTGFPWQKQKPEQVQVIGSIGLYGSSDVISAMARPESLAN